MPCKLVTDTNVLRCYSAAFALMSLHSRGGGPHLGWEVSALRLWFVGAQAGRTAGEVPGGASQVSVWLACGGAISNLT
jgi:hypothetical protein